MNRGVLDNPACGPGEKCVSVFEDAGNCEPKVIIAERSEKVSAPSKLVPMQQPTTSPHPYLRASSTNAENNSPTLDEVYNWFDQNYVSRYAIRQVATIHDFLLKLRPYLESLSTNADNNSPTLDEVYNWLDHNYHGKWAIWKVATIHDFLLKLRPYLESLSTNAENNSPTLDEVYNWLDHNYHSKYA